MDRHFRSQLDGSLLSSFEESLLEIDEEEDTTDFCEPFFTSAATAAAVCGSTAGNDATGFTLTASESDQCTSSSSTTAFVEESSPTSDKATSATNVSQASTTTLKSHDFVVWQNLLENRFCRHNKDLRLICQDGSAQIDAILFMPFVQGTSFFGQKLASMGRNRNSEGCVLPQTVILPDIHLYEVHQIMTLLHKGRIISTSEKAKRAIIDLLSLLGLSLDGLIIEEVPKLPVDQHYGCDHFRAEQQHRLILSIKAPLDQEDLFQPSNCTTQIKRGSNKYMQQKVAFFIMPPTFPNAGTLENAKTPWVPNIKEGKEDIGDAEDVKDFFVDPNLISIAKSSGSAVDKKGPPQNKRLLHQVMDKLGATLTSTRQATNDNLAVLQSKIKVTHTLESLEMNAKTEKAIYSCDLCSRGSSKFSLISFLKHQKSAHINDCPYKCSYPGCKKTFKTLSEFRAHKRVAHKPRIKGGGSSGNKSSWGNHHMKSDYYCNQCDKRFKSVGSLKTHMISHISLPALPGRISGPPKTPFSETVIVPESVASGVFTCRICATPHVTWTEFSKHFQKVHGAVPKILLQYKCVPCDLLFQNKQVYLEHNIKCHENPPIQVAPTVTKKAKLSIDKTEIDDDTHFMFQTEKQNKTTSSSDLAPELVFNSEQGKEPLDTQESIMKTDIKSDKLIWLNRNEKDPNLSLYQIVNSQPTPNCHTQLQLPATPLPPVDSIECNKLAAEASTPIRESLTIKPSTSLEKKHICPICSRGFKRSDNLKAHARTVHYGVKANNCSACGKGYRTKNELLRHQTKTCLYREMIRSQEESGQRDDDFNLDFDESLLI